MMQKKALRRTLTGPKSYAEPQQEALQMLVDSAKRKNEKQTLVKDSIFQHKNWTTKEKIRLMVFFAYYLKLPDWTSERRSIYLYKHLSTFLKKSRTPQQCKNIHSLLKRKFNSLQDTIEAMQLELQFEENYERLVEKYEKEIENYEGEHRLFLNIEEDHHYEPLMSRKTGQRDQPMWRIKTGLQVKGSSGSMIKSEDSSNSFLQRRAQILQNCDFYWRQWLKCTVLLNHRRSQVPQSSQ